MRFSVWPGSIPHLEFVLRRFYTTYRLLPVIKESVVVIASPGFGKFYDEKDPGFEKPENRKQLTMIRQGRRDALFLDAIFKAHPPPLSPTLTIRNSQYVTRRLHSIIYSLGSWILTPFTIKDFHRCLSV